MQCCLTSHLHAACTCMQRTHLSFFFFVCFFCFFLLYLFPSYHFLLFYLQWSGRYFFQLFVRNAKLFVHFYRLTSIDARFLKILISFQFEIILNYKLIFKLHLKNRYHDRRHCYLVGYVDTNLLQ